MKNQSYYFNLKLRKPFSTNPYVVYCDANHIPQSRRALEVSILSGTYLDGDRFLKSVERWYPERASGRILCAGNNEAGQVEPGATATFIKPEDFNQNADPFTNLFGVVDFSLASSHSCVVAPNAKKTNELFCFGSNENGALGQAKDVAFKTTSATSSLKSAELDYAAVKIVSVHSGNGAACIRAANQDGQFGIVCLGPGQHGRRGINSNYDAISDLSVSNLALIAFSSGTPHPLVVATTVLNTCAIFSDGSLRCWGEATLLGTAQDIGDDPDEMVALNAVDLGTAPGTSGGTLVTLALDLETTHLCVVFTGGEVKCVGDNARGQTGSRSNVATTVSQMAATAFISFSGDGAKAIDVSTAETHTCVLFSGNKGRCFGHKLRISSPVTLAEDFGSAAGPLMQTLPYLQAPAYTAGKTLVLTDLKVTTVGGCALYENVASNLTTTEPHVYIFFTFLILK